MDDIKKSVELPLSPREKLDNAAHDALVQIKARRQMPFGCVVVLYGLNTFV